ncbi:gamma-glutamyltransferase family protein [Asanoa iriomotensis]|uniref:Gamma-glutamyltranspeptidase n=1 Tax=Asanoa iriomotensis TaxID=234613 RepID=A0ABQ4BZX7_9ACTN|nr:gamma-glutamyltransferase family protein [Asanoa iriomotensis]GIF56076.1 gamma-glutamyltranspeptidase [Asanoa iriomotensis]
MFTTRPELTGTFGMVASTHWLASQSGMAVLEAGGNAFDAAVAAGFVLQVVEPHMNGPLGEVPIIGHAAATGETFVVDGQGPAPAGATVAHFADLGLDLVPGTGLLPACVPGAFGAWLALLQAHGTMRFGDVVSYAIGYADGGYPLPVGARDTIAAVADLFRTEWTDSAKVYLPGGGVPAAGSRFRNPALAAMFRRLADAAQAAGRDRDAQLDAARAAFYDGFVAETIASYVDKNEALDSSGRRHKGVLAHADLAGHRTRFEAPLTYDYHGYTVCKPGPWSQGPVFLQQLALLAGFDLAGLPTDSAEFAHLVIECAKLAFADREAFYGDPRWVDVPLDTLLGADYNADRRALVGERASAELRPGSPDGVPPRLPALPEWRGGAAVGIGEPTVARDGRTRGDTCHLDVVDRWGNMVSATPSGAWLQSSPVIPDLGVCLGTRGQMFWLTPGLPNSLAPGKRPRTTLTPSFALRDGAPYLAFGTPGGDQQDQWSLLFFLRHVHHGLGIQAAIDAPAWHTTHFPSSFWPRDSRPAEVHIEARADPATIAGLRARGHDVVVTDPWSLGRVSAAGRAADGMLKAAANPREMQGYAVGR